ncbi:MAG: hypothetical protein E7302_13235 [Butyrivibrio sp.]|nr:hypothetical protein [Butyrivibrio sp.]
MADSKGREALIHSLAQSMGMGDAQKRTTTGRYNAETGTIMSNGRVISNATVVQAKNYFTAQYNKLCEMDDEGAKQMATLYEVAMEAIGIMVDSGKGTTE